MRQLDVLRYVSTLGIIYTVADGATLSATQFPVRAISVKGANVSMNCSFGLFDSNAWMNVYWRRGSKNRTLDVTADERKVMIPLKQGSSELHLLNVSFQDAGVYHCSVRDRAGKISNGNGTELIVHVPPTPVKVTLLSSSPLTLLCTTAGFFPAAVNITWYGNDIELISGVNSTVKWNEEGLYEASSSVRPVEIEQVYKCQVSHVSLEVPANSSYRVRGQAHGSATFPYIFGCAGGGLIILLLIILVKVRKICITKGTGMTDTIPGQFEKQTQHEGEAEILSYTAVKFREQKKNGKRRHQEDQTVYAQIKQGADVKLMYVSLDFATSQKTE